MVDWNQTSNLPSMNQSTSINQLMVFILDFFVFQSYVSMTTATGSSDTTTRLKNFCTPHELSIHTTKLQAGTSTCTWQRTVNWIDCCEIMLLLLMEKILHHLLWYISHYLQGFIHPRWCRISIDSSRFDPTSPTFTDVWIRLKQEEGELVAIPYLFTWNYCENLTSCTLQNVRQISKILSLDPMGYMEI